MSAFERLWADVHPALIRYLRVVAVADADDIACESWVAVVRRLRSFEGDETAWRTLVFSAARMHAEDENQRRVWDAMVEDDQVTAVVAEPLPPGEEPFEGDELEGGPAHGLRMAIEAIRDLPPEQGEVLVLRRVALLPEEDVAHLLGTDLTAVHTVEQTALDQLGLDAELLTWALGAEPRPVELADEDTIVGVYRAMVPEQPSASSVARGGTAAGTGARVIALGSPTWRVRAGAVAAVSAAVVGLGAFSAAAYQGVLPDPVQNVMHVVIGAPEPTPEETSAAPLAVKPHKAKTTAVRTAPHATAATKPRTNATHSLEMSKPMAQGLCRAWSVERSKGLAEKLSNAFLSLVQAAPGGDVEGYCRTQAAPLKPVPTPKPMATTASPTEKATPKATKSGPAQKPTPKVPPTKPTQVPTTKPTVGPTTASPPTTATTAPPPTATTTAAAPGGAGAGAAGSGGAQSQGAGSRSTDSPAGGKGGQARGQG